MCSRCVVCSRCGRCGSGRCSGCSGRVVVFALVGQPSVFLLTVFTLRAYKYYFAINNSSGNFL